MVGFGLLRACFPEGAQEDESKPQSGAVAAFRECAAWDNQPFVRVYLTLLVSADPSSTFVAFQASACQEQARNQLRCCKTNVWE